MKSNIIPVIRINPGSCNYRSAKISADVFNSNIRFTLPALGVLQCYIEKNEIGETELFYFSDKSMEESVIKEKIDKLYQSVEE